MRTNFLTLAATILTMGLLASCDITPKDAVRIPGAGVTIDKDTLRMRASDTPVKLTATVAPGITVTTIDWDSDDECVATVDPEGNVKAVSAGITKITATTGDGSNRGSCVVIVRYDLPEYVTIGGLEWATTNIGASTVAGSYVTCAGDFYQWGSINRLYKSVTWDGTSANFTWRAGKEKGFVADNLEMTSNVNIHPARDVVQQYVGEGWRMPTMADFIALMGACIKDYSPAYQYLDMEVNPSGESATVSKGVYWCSDYDGAAGVLLCDGTRRLFLPAAGTGTGTVLKAGEKAAYWSSNISTDSGDCAQNVFIGTSNSLKIINIPNLSNRFNCGSIRPVRDID